jgi:ferrochelatase
MRVKTTKKAVLIVNLGTPDSPSVPDVRKYLREFLMDGRVIDIPLLSRWMLVNLIIAPFRAPKSAKVYKELWQDRGSPLMFYGQDLKRLLSEALGDEYVVELAMRYQSPSIAKGLEALKKHRPEKILIIPLFPQYASASTGSVADKVMEIVRTWQVIPHIEFVEKFADDALFIQAFAEVGGKYLKREAYDHVLFSYHGLPERQIRKASVDGYCQLNQKCCASYHSRNQYCYRAQCYQTTRKLAEALNLEEKQYTVVFQSRLGSNPWIQPYADEVIKNLPAQGHKRVLIFCPSFIADCLETTIEAGVEFKEYFLEAGGEHWQMVESLNDNPLWVACLKNMVLARF